jgi:signal transduction histidine kinase
MKLPSVPFLKQIGNLLRGAPPPVEQSLPRLLAVERNIILPVKGLYLGLLIHQLLVLRWVEDVAVPRSGAQQLVDRFFVIYFALSLGLAMILLRASHFQPTVVQRTAYASSLLDGLFMAALTFVTGGFDSMVYWLFPGLIARNALICPIPTQQLTLNFAISSCYIVAGVWDLAFSAELDDFGNPTVRHPAEPFLLRLIILLLWSACCCVLQALIDRQRAAEEEAREHASRSDQLRSAGRLASEIAHQIKNPLGIINNAAYALQCAIQESKGDPLQQVQIIREEVARSDRIITELMGYAQLAEGKVERLEINEELDHALAEVFPRGIQHNIKIDKDYESSLPVLLMQRRHLSEVLVNLIQNAREAFTRRGRLAIRTRLGPDSSVIVTIADDGPGISPTKLGRIFEPYFTTKEKGSGLGLSIVKHNVEMYGGTVEVQSELGKGTRFVLHFPTRTFMKIKS